MKYPDNTELQNTKEMNRPVEYHLIGSNTYGTFVKIKLTP